MTIGREGVFTSDVKCGNSKIFVSILVFIHVSVMHKVRGKGGVGCIVIVTLSIQQDYGRLP